MPPVSASVKQTAYETIRLRILTGQLLPGTVLSEADLQRELGLTRGPVREALARLEAEGLAEPDASKAGLRVHNVHGGTIHAAAGMRLALEPLIVWELARRSEKERDLTEVEGLLARQDDLARRAGAGAALEDKVAFFEADMDFHGALAHRAGYHQAPPFLRLLHQQLQLAVIPTLGGQMDWVVAHHRAIVEAIRRGEPERAAREMRAHLTDAAHFWWGHMHFLTEELPPLFRLLGDSDPPPSSS